MCNMMQIQNHMAPLEERLENQDELVLSATSGTYFGEKDTRLVPFYFSFCLNACSEHTSKC